MARRDELVYAPQAVGHLRRIARKYHSLIRSAIEEQLRFQPEVETKNRKPLRPPGQLGGAWELRAGPGNRFRVFYEVDRERTRVEILAIGRKVRNRLLIGTEEIEL